MLTVFWCSRGIIWWDLLPAGTSINSRIYCEQLEKMNKLLRWGPLKEHLGGGKLYLLLQDNARPHIANNTAKKMSELGLQSLPHPAAYSPDLAPSDYHLLRSLKNYLSQGKELPDRATAEGGIGEILQLSLDTSTSIVRALRASLPGRCGRTG
jgi:[histone H3]-lysine36 N-dimethyltransferase SETMAR